MAESHPTSILIIEDDRAMRASLVELCTKNGYGTYTLSRFSNLAHEVASSTADLVLLDLNLPGIDGRYLLAEIRRHSHIPIIVVTAESSDLDEVICFSAGADDFVAKPFNPHILLARISSVLNRSSAAIPKDTITQNGLTLDLRRCQAIYQENSCPITKNEMRILALLMRNSPTVVERSIIREELWSTDEFIDDNTLSVNVSHLRTTLEKLGVPPCIHTTRGIGYHFEISHSRSED